MGTDSMTQSERADRLDTEDEFQKYREQFSIPNAVYLSGHSLGLMSDVARGAIEKHLNKWATEGVRGHFLGGEKHEAWASLEDAAAGKAACDIVGAQEGEVVYMNSLTVNMHLLLTAFYTPNVDSGRVEIICEEHAFPSDEYALQSHLRTRGVDHEQAITRIQPRPGEHLLREEDILSEITRRSSSGTLALVFLPGVQYFTGQVFPMASIASLCRDAGVPLGLDLAHAVGNVPLSLHEWNVDFAVWCSYKYLNSGPGSLGGAFVHSMHGDCSGRDRLGGWWGHDRTTRFLMEPHFVPQSGVRGFQISNPAVFALAPVIASLKLFESAGGVVALRRKSVKLVQFLEELIDSELGDEVEILSPRDPLMRGNQLSLRLRSNSWSARDVHGHLAAKGVLCDVREPNTLRVAAAPLYNSFRDVHAFVVELRRVLTKKPL